MTFRYQYHIPSAMMAGKWNWFEHQFNNPRSIVGRVILTHFRGSDLPEAVEIWIKQGKKLRKFTAREIGPEEYQVEPIRS